MTVEWKKQIRLVMLIIIGTHVINNCLTIEASSMETRSSGVVKVEGNSKSITIDPENPDDIVNPGKSPVTEGPLRIDYVSSLNFGTAQIKKNSRIYYGQAQQFYGGTGPRGSYIQITDQREKSTGWSVQVKQNYQFETTSKTGKKQELRGATLTLDKGWANSSGYSQSPTVTRETIEINSIGSVYELATAVTGSGQGVWTISFGASGSNSNNQDNTLKPIIGRDGKTVLDEIYGKEVYSNTAVALRVPEHTVIYPGTYETELIWILGELP